MDNVKAVIRRLAGNRRELQKFLQAPEQWVQESGVQLSDGEKEEMLRVASDLSALAEKRCKEALGYGPEERFSQGKSIERRRFLLTASSGILSGILLAAGAGLARAASRGQGGGAAGGEGAQGVLATDSTCTNAPCTNISVCTDDTQCADSGCINQGGPVGTNCSDVSCQDLNPCTNNPLCDDSQLCWDKTCENNGQTGSQGCNDDTSCQDTPQCGNAQQCVDHSNCLDSGCVNAGQRAQACADSFCTDDPCQNISPSACVDLGGCINAPGC